MAARIPLADFLALLLAPLLGGGAPSLNAIPGAGPLATTAPAADDDDDGLAATPAPVAEEEDEDAVASPVDTAQWVETV